MNYKAIAQKAIDDFLKGDIPSIINTLDENVEWINPDAPEVPFAISVKGKDKVPSFFSKIAETADISRFEMNSYIQEDNIVVSWGSYDAKAKPTGKSFTTPIIMRWEFNPEGKCTRWQAYTNTSAQSKAYTK